MQNGEALASVVSRLGLVNPEDPVKDEDGNVTVYAPVAEASSSAVTLINPSRAELLGGLCKRCHSPFNVGLEVQYPPPHTEAAPFLVCAACCVSMFNAGQRLKVTWV